MVSLNRRPFHYVTAGRIGNAVALILNHRISCLPVMDNDHLCGILTTSDLLMALERIVEYFEQDAGGCSIRQPLKVTAQMDDESVAQVAG